MLSQVAYSAPLVEPLSVLESVPPSLVPEELLLDIKWAKKENKCKKQDWMLVYQQEQKMMKSRKIQMNSSAAILK